MAEFKWDWEQELDPYSRWMVKSNLKRISDGEYTCDELVATLKANGYIKVAAAVEQEHKKNASKS